MEIHALQTGTVRVKQFQLIGASTTLSRLYQLLFTQQWSEWMPIYCWLIKLDDRLVLVDTGETTRINEEGYLPKGGLYHKAVQTRITKEDEIPNQLKTLGYKTTDIATIILTHLHGDHIGGIEHFPHANFLVSRTEYDFATSKKGPGSGYFTKNWPNSFAPELIDYTSGAEGNFDKSYVLKDAGEVIIVPTPGHSVGHQSVIVNKDGQSYFIGGDLTYNLQTLIKGIPNVVLANSDANNSVKKTHDYVKSHSSVFLSSHDWNAPTIAKAHLKYLEM